MASHDLNLVDISTVQQFSFAGIVTDCKVIKIKSPTSITVLMNIDNKYNNIVTSMNITLIILKNQKNIIVNIMNLTIILLNIKVMIY